MKVRIPDEILNVCLASLAGGVLFMDHCPGSPKILIVTCAATAIIVLAATWRRKNLSVCLVAAIIFFALGSLRFYAVETLPPDDVSNFAGQSVQISGIVRDEVRKKILPNGLTQLRLVVDAKAITLNGSTKKVSGGLILTYYPKEDAPSVQIGDKIVAVGNLKLLHNYNNPGQIDVVTRMKCDGITARMSANKNGIEVEPVAGTAWTKFLRGVSAIRQHYKEAMSKVMSREDASALFAMLFGGYEGLNPDLVEEFQTTGIVHILSVSGSHMSMLAMATAALCAGLKLPRTVTFSIGLLVIGTYALLSALLPQVIRASMMGILIFLAKTLNAESEGARLLTITALAMLINQPLLLFDVSFQLSFASTAGLMYLSENLREKLKRLPNFISEAAAMTIAAQVASLPIIIWYFNRISLSSVLSNALVMPLLEIVIIGGLLSGIIAAVVPLAGRILFVVMAMTFGAGEEVNRILAHIPFSSIQVPTLGLAAGFFYYVALITRRPIILLPIILITALSIFKPSGNCEVAFVDVGQGDCAVVITPNRKCLIFDTGGVREKMFDIGERVLVPYLKHENVRAVEKIFLTHAHEDHAGGTGAVIKNFPVKEIITAGEPLDEYAAVFGIAKERLKNVRVGHEGEIFTIDGVQVEILFAPQIGSDNEISNVYRIRCGEVTFLITGDLVKEMEKQILSAGIDVGSTVLKVGHHGSKTSSSEEFLQAVKPKCAVICVGYGNTFGHPHPEILERLKNLPTKIFRTDRDGLIKFSTNGKSLRLK